MVWLSFLRESLYRRGLEPNPQHSQGVRMVVPILISAFVALLGEQC